MTLGAYVTVNSKTMQEIKVILQEYFHLFAQWKRWKQQANETARGENELKAIPMCWRWCGFAFAALQ